MLSINVIFILQYKFSLDSMKDAEKKYHVCSELFYGRNK